MNSEELKNREIFEEIPVRKALVSMAVPMIVSQLIVLVYNMADTFFIGRANNPYMVAGASLILPIYNVCIAFANIAGTGGGTLIARLLGAGRIEEAKKVSSFSFYFTIAASLVFSLGTALFMDPLLKLLGASNETYRYAEQYVTCVIVFGALPTVLSMTLGTLVRNTGKAKEAGFGVSMGGILNIALDPIFMFVILPRGNETLGAGIATALSNLVSCIYFIVLILQMDSSILSFSPRNGFPLKEEIRSFFAVGVPAALGPFFFDLDYIVIDRLAASYSDVALAAIGIVLKAERIPLNTGVGLCLGMVPLAAYNYSSGNHKRMHNVFLTARRAGLIIALCCVAFYEFFAPWIMRFFIADAETVALGTSFLKIRALATPLMFLCFVHVHFFQAVGRGNTSFLLIAVRWLAVNIPMLFILNHLFGMYGIIWSQLVSDSLVALFSFAVHRKFYTAGASGNNKANLSSASDKTA